MMIIKTLHTLDTEYSADSVEWCPYPKFNNFFVCGTYQLEEGADGDSSSAPCARKGRIYLFQFDKATKELKELQRLETAAILDMKWMPLKQSTCEDEQQVATLATADALGNLQVFVLENGKLVLSSSLNINPKDSKLLILSLDWNWPLNGSGGEEKRCILVSDSKGNISLVNYVQQEKGGSVLQKQHTWNAHGFEAWICAFDKWNPNVVYTGGDDALLHTYDLRSYHRQMTTRSHIAGVTCLLSHPRHENILLTGSYDERLKVFDTRSMAKPLGEVNLKGGVWRLKPDPLNRNLILAACMYNNFSIVKLEEMSKPTLVGEYRQHESICYGSDWCLSAQPDDDELYMATCSFYDHKLCVASVANEE